MRNTSKLLLRKSLAVVALAIMMMASGCSGPKEIAYFQDFDNIVVESQNMKRNLTVKPEDKLQIQVVSKDPEMAALFNLPVQNTRAQRGLNGMGQKEGSGQIGYTNSEQYLYYTVDAQGNIDMPQLGKVHVAGLNRSEVAALVKGEIIGRGLLKDPVVTVEFMNTGISVLGEVMTPGRFAVNRDHVTLLDAIAMAGDLTIQGRRDNVLVVRESDGKRETYRVDLTNGAELLNSPAYYLQQDDVVYVEPNAYRKRQTTVNGNNVLSASFWVSVASLLTSIAVLIFK